MLPSAYTSAPVRAHIPSSDQNVRVSKGSEGKNIDVKFKRPSRDNKYKGPETRSGPFQNTHLSDYCLMMRKAERPLWLSVTMVRIPSFRALMSM